MALTQTQCTTLNNAIAADPVLSQYPHTSDGAFSVAEALNVLDDPPTWGYNTSLAEKSIYELTSVDNTTWDWSTYMAQTAQERDAWGRLFTSGAINYALTQTRAGIQRIFSGNTVAALAQRAHIDTLGRRRMTRGEHILALGSGTPASPAVLTFEGPLAWPDIMQAWEMG